MAEVTRIVFAAAAAILLLAVSVQGQVANCEGFVRSSQNIDLNEVKVKLVSLEGVEKDSVDVTPFNGYFIIPLYERGSFVLQVSPPSGWSFEPETVRVSDQTCTSNNDFFFDFAGFSISGRVLSQGRADGPGEVQIRLFAAAGKEALQSAETSDTGAYAFSRILPGSYRLEASHPSFAFSQSSAFVEVTSGNVDVKTPFTVSGFHVSGSVFSDGRAIENIAFFLVGDKHIETTCRPSVAPKSTQLPSQIEKLKAAFVCQALSDKAGHFSFANIPAGTYQIIPFYEQDGVHYDVIPSKQTVEVTTSSVVTKDFEIGGFSAVGRVVHAGSEKKGFKNAVISTSKHNNVATADSEGNYKLDGVKSGKEIIKVTAVDVQFKPLEIDLSPSNARIPDISVDSYRVTGFVQLDTGKESRVVHVRGPLGTKDIGTSSDGRFEFWATPGTYYVEPVVSDVEKAQGLVISPPHHTITVTDSPVYDIGFGQSKSVVSGTVRCLETPCGAPVSVTLSHTQRNVKVTTNVDDDDTFRFENVLPGQYKVSISPVDKFCWEAQTIDTEVAASSEASTSSIEFVQAGFVLKVSTTHPVDLHFALTNDPQEQSTLSLKKKANSFCLRKSGTYKLTPQGCYHFERDHYNHDTAHPSVIELVVSEYQLKGTINAASPIGDLTVEIAHDNDVDTVPAVLVGSNGYHYQFVFYGRSGHQITITPKSTEVLFYPASREISVQTYEDCAAPVEPFVARRGQYWEGLIDPHIAGVRVVAIAADQVMAESFSKGDGTFRVGPLYDDVTYTLRAQKDGYTFSEADADNKFKAKKLSDISVEVKHDGEGVQGVLISLTGNSFRSNNHTNEHGAFTFWALQPSQYFLRPVLKEYLFEPTSQTITLAEGDSVIARFNAVRTGYSVFGKISSLVGEGQGGLTIEAISTEQNHREQTISEPDGTFRLRGLKPGLSYKIQVLLTKGIRRVIPQDGHLVNIVKQDVRSGVDFIALLRRDIVDITGRLLSPSFNKQDLAGLKIDLFKESDTETPLRSIDAGPTSFFEFRDLKGDETYFIRLRTVSKGQLDGVRIDSSNKFNVLPSADSSVYHVDIPFSSLIKKDGGSNLSFSATDLDTSGSSGSLLLVFAIGVAIFAGLNYNQTNRFVQSVIAQANSTSGTNDRTDFLPAQQANSALKNRKKNLN